MNTMAADVLVIQCKESQLPWYCLQFCKHYGDDIMSAMASQITGVSIVCSTIWSGADQRKHQSSMSLAFARGIHQWSVDSPHKVPVTRKVLLFDDISMIPALALEGLIGLSLEIHTVLKTKILNLIFFTTILCISIKIQSAVFLRILLTTSIINSSDGLM